SRGRELRQLALDLVHVRLGDSQVLDHLAVLLLALAAGAVADPVKERGELVEVVLSPLVEWVLVALGALEPDAEERVAEIQSLLLGLADQPLGPEVGHRVALREVGWILVAEVAALLLAEFLVALAGFATGGQHDAFDKLVVRDVLFDPAVEPLVPLAGKVL